MKQPRFNIIRRDLVGWLGDRFGGDVVYEIDVIKLFLRFSKYHFLKWVVVFQYHILWVMCSDNACVNLTVAPEVRKKRKHQQRRIPTNDELFYDPEEDNRDQAWVDMKRRR